MKFPTFTVCTIFSITKCVNHEKISTCKREAKTVRQGSLISSYLFNKFIEEDVIKINEKFMNDLVLVGDSEIEINKMLNI